MGQYYQPPPPGYGTQPQYAPEPPEAGSIKSLLNIAGIISLIFGILFILGAVAFLLFTFFFGFIISVIYLVFGVVDLLIFMNCRSISDMVGARQYEQAKSKTLVWMIIGFIFGGLLPGIIILIAYLKFDPLINAARAPQGYGYMPPPPPPQQGYRQCMGCGQQIPANSYGCPYCGRQG